MMMSLSFENGELRVVIKSMLLKRNVMYYCSVIYLSLTIPVAASTLKTLMFIWTNVSVLDANAKQISIRVY